MLKCMRFSSTDWRSLFWMSIVAEFQKEMGNFSSPVKPFSLKSMLSSLKWGLSSQMLVIRFSKNFAS